MAYWSLIGLLLWVATLLASTLLIKKLLLFKFIKSVPSKPLPPGPRGWPLVGNIFDLGEVPHQTFYNLQARYGPVLWLKLGSINTMVVQSAEAATELFKKCDLAFSDRKVPDSMTSLGYNQGSVAIGAYSDYWRRMRRICSMEFLVHKRVNESTPIRQKYVDEMVELIKRDVEENGVIQLDRFLFDTSFKTVGNILLSEKVMDSKLDKAGEFFESLSQYLEWVGKPNLADFFPVLKWMDPQRIKRNTSKYLGKLLRFSSEIVNERINDKEKEYSGTGDDEFKLRRNDFLDVLLSEGEAYEDGSDKLSVKNISIILLEMFFGGTETTSTTIEWGMTELVRNPKSMKTLQDEIDQVVGTTRKVQEDDLARMPYLQAIVKEIMRLHPAIQMLLPRNSMEDTEYMGYFVPKDTQVLVNAWAIHRDPAAWSDPLSFKPERFLGSNIDLKGQDFQLIPFGSGRRSCLGLTLGHKMVSLSIASLLQTFDWRLADGIEPEELDMREMMGLTLRKKVPLKLIPSLRE